MASHATPLNRVECRHLGEYAATSCFVRCRPQARLGPAFERGPWQFCPDRTAIEGTPTMNSSGQSTMAEDTEIKLYFDYKSPFAFLAMEPAFELPDTYRVSVRWIPYLLRIKGKGERTVYSEWKVRYSYMDARRWANRRGGFPIKGPLKVYDSTASLIGALFAQEHDFFRPYSELVYSRFFERALEIDIPEAVAGVIEELGHSGSDFQEWSRGEGNRRLEACLAEGHDDHVFGVPIFIFEGEQFWGHDRIVLLEERLVERGLRR